MSQEIANQFPAIARNYPEMIAQLASNNGARNSHTHPEVWFPGNSLDYFLSTGALSVNDHKHVTPIQPSGWASLTNGRYISG